MDVPDASVAMGRPGLSESVVVMCVLSGSLHRENQRHRADLMGWGTRCGKYGGFGDEA